MAVEQGSGRRVQAWNVKLNKDRAKGSGLWQDHTSELDLRNSLIKKTAKLRIAAMSPADPPLPLMTPIIAFHCLPFLKKVSHCHLQGLR